MRPPNCPPYLWIHAAEQAVSEGHKIKNFWGWARRERTFVLLASLDAIPSGITATLQPPPEEAADLCFTVYFGAYQACWEAAHAAVCEVLLRRRRKMADREH
jgi:hypothetical protein